MSERRLERWTVQFEVEVQQSIHEDSGLERWSSQLENTFREILTVEE